MAGSHSENGSNCKRCSDKDTDEMVQCDVCDHWYHFNCVGVDHNIANVSWSCENCKGASSMGHADLATNTSTPTTYTTNIQGSSADSQRLNQQAYLTLPPSQAPLVPPPHALGNTGVRTQPISMTTAMIPPPASYITAPLSSIYTTPLMSYITPVSWQNSCQPIMPAYTPPNFAANFLHLENTLSRAQSQTTHTMTSSNIDNIEMQRNLELKKLEEEMQLKRQYLDAKYKILTETNGSSALHRQIPLNAEPMLNAAVNIGPTPAQIAARQSFPKQLPTFNGDPDEWPLFISSFENSTNLAGYTDAENLIRQQSSLKGKAREVVKNKLLVPQMVPDIIRTLRMCFGRPEHILERAISKARSFPPIKDKLDILVEFALCVQNIYATMEGCQMHHHLNNPLLVKELVDKLPNSHKLSWAMYLKDDRVPVVKSFSDWLYHTAEAASTVTPLFGKATASVNTHRREEDSLEFNNVNTSNAVSTLCIVCNNGGHKVAQCDVFRNMTLNRKWECIKSKNICRQCLGRHRRKCNYNKECDIDGCKYKHNPLLHKQINTERNITDDSQSTQQNSIVNAHSNQYDESQPFFRIIPVNIHASNKIKRVFAFLDEGSAVTLIEKHIFDEMGLEGECDPLCLRWTGDTTRMENDSVKGNIIISNVTNNKKFQLNAVHTVTNLGLSSQSVDASEISKRYRYLANLPIESYHNATPAILFGADNWNLAIPLKIREGLGHQPIASKTRLGWTLQGCSSDGAREFRLNVHTCDCQQKYNELHDMVKKFFCLELSRPTQLFSQIDNKALEILDHTCKKVNGRYEVGLLWRNQNVRLPDSYSVALNRLKCLLNKFNRNPSLKTTLQQQIDNLLLKGYAKKLTSDELKVHHDKTWYLPIFVVSNPNKPDKVRLVWDAAAKSNGMSLNDFMITGPDLLNPLVEILLNFRVGKTAICGDISEMFHRVNIKENDMHAQRFLWYEKEDEQAQPTIFVMRALTFGISCAPCIAHYVQDKNANLFNDKYPRAVEAIQRNHYVDDFIDSAADEKQAIELAKRVRQIHEAGGFQMHNWASNSKMVLDELHSNNLPKQEMKDWGSTTKVLGLYWDPNNDQFRFICRFARLRRDVLNEPLTPTKRETLQVLMSIYDPLGFASCYTIGLKILLQEIWRSGIAWDEKLVGALEKRWCKWRSIISKITSIRIPRCYSPVMPTADEIQLHTFVDASECAYAAVCYLRIKKDDFITVSLVAAKNRVAPLKPLSIPRLELQAAVLGARLGKKIQQIRRIKTNAQFWWSDSKTVLMWLKIDPKRFQQFVMHRVGEILENTNVSQWRWIPSKQNPADLATKTLTQLNTQLWFDGPEFLIADERQWPQCDNFGTFDGTEMKHCALTFVLRCGNFFAILLSIKGAG